MIRTYGTMPTSIPKGYFKAIHFPVLARLDTQTGDHRLLSADGAETRDLPLSIRLQRSASYGHEGAVTSGAVFQVIIDPDTGVMSGDGFLLDDVNGRDHARLVYTGAQRGNSIDIAEASARLEEDLETGEWWINFTKFKLAATTGVATPAFADARGEIAEMSDEELTASLGDDPMQPLVAPEAAEFVIHVIGEPTLDTEITAGMLLAPYDAFYEPEADVPTKFTVDANGWGRGHLALWESCHDGRTDVCLRVPRPTDGYASFNKPGPLTEHGQVQTGPIFAFGGHRPSKSAATIEQAYGGIENAWMDVRVTEGRLGPWCSGFVRPGTPDETVYAARASRLSGHWVDGRLKAIVSVNAEGFDVPGSSQPVQDLVAGFAFTTNGGGVAELVASLPGCVTEPTLAEQLADARLQAEAVLARLDEIGAKIQVENAVELPFAEGAETPGVIVDLARANALMAEVLEAEADQS